MRVFVITTVLALTGLGFVARAGDPPKSDKPVVAGDKKDGEKKDAKKDEKMGRAEIGKAAPEFALTDVNGKTVKLSDYKGKIVVLEWFNPQCPFVVYAHGEKGPLRDMASTVAADGIVWLSINSSAPGKEGAGLEINKKMGEEWKIKNPILLDESGTVGMKYGAKTTPHMYIIDPAGKVVYNGAIDDKRSTNPADVKTSKNYVVAALDELKAGKPVSTASTAPYGCTIKYK